MEDNDGDHRGPLLPRHEPSTWRSLTWTSATSWDEDTNFDHALRASAVSGRAPARLRPRPAAGLKRSRAPVNIYIYIYIYIPYIYNCYTYIIYRVIYLYLEKE